MKIKSILVVISAIVLITVSCKKGDSFLDKKNTNTLNETTTFADSANTMAFLTRIYVNVGFLFPYSYHAAGGSAVIADEAASGYYNGAQNSAVMCALGTLGATSTNAEFANMWKTPYENIRRVNVLLKNIGNSPLSAAKKKLVIAESRFLRAWYYFLLVRTYGGVPLLGDKVYDITEDFSIERSSYSDCVNYIVSECDAAKIDLPTFRAQPAEDYGRVTQGACMGLKSRMLLYAASPLFNGGQYAASGTVRDATGYSSYDRERWNKAAQAALDVINTGQYALYEDNTTRLGYGFYRTFHIRYNNEYLFGAMRGNQREFETYLLPPTRSGYYYHVASQNLVDAFPMANGLPITDPASGYSENNPYVNRDPRFGNSIIYNGALWYLSSANADREVYTYVGSGTADAVGASIAYSTGYFDRKMLLEGSAGNTERCWPLIRYAEILLNYAESVNEYSGPTAEVYNTLKIIRKRAGILPGTDGNYGLKTGITQEQMRAIIQTERQIELAFEEHRMWDARRWKIADVVFTKPTGGMRITKIGNTYTYTRFDVRPHAFPKQFGLFPIPEAEIAKNVKLIQNAGW
ncbi:RagB/SusD family nutrient uptake outer membrane protein [Pedobacter sp. AW1-32]|uniref:RagB/SusD family nutrient uptake outer membrane protein n=1 Tax=Pedobacter sp. AW1-32 TaxID=3383026 RepID=UPI003FF0903F